SSTADGQRGTPRRPSADGVTRLPSPLPYVFHLQGIAPKLLTHRLSRRDRQRARTDRRYGHNRRSTACAEARAWAMTATETWVRIWYRTNSIIAWAMSASRMRDSAAWRFSAVVARLLMVCSSRFCSAHMDERWDYTARMASSTRPMAASASSRISTLSPPRPRA